ncbi:predicted protein [Chaetoceros tenuissimus]|uniref:Uncharacterized protein n=1 Tax=Chaetoceros tenuissimus TaxID=426638 RepID=A0AAD3H373_9STRA|nr:predicted protein [Chaetoceros tenuissimus]
MPKEITSPAQVHEFPFETYIKLPKLAEHIPSTVRIHIFSWMFMTHHEFCAHAPIDEIPAVLRNFDVEHKFGKERRSPKLVVKDGRTLPIFVFMAKGITGRCYCCWPCQLCGLSLCEDPSDLTCKPCQPLDKSEKKLINPEWEPYDLLLYYLTKSRQVDSTFHPNKYRKNTLSGRAEEIFYENALSYPDGVDILNYLHSKIDLGQAWEEKKAALVLK